MNKRIGNIGYLIHANSVSFVEYKSEESNDIISMMSLRIGKFHLNETHNDTAIKFTPFDGQTNHTVRFSFITTELASASFVINSFYKDLINYSL